MFLEQFGRHWFQPVFIPWPVRKTFCASMAEVVFSKKTAGLKPVLRGKIVGCQLQWVDRNKSVLDRSWWEPRTFAMRKLLRKLHLLSKYVELKLLVTVTSSCVSHSPFESRLAIALFCFNSILVHTLVMKYGVQLQNRLVTVCFRWS